MKDESKSVKNIEVPGEVVEQNIVPGTTHCHPVFVREWSRLLQLRYNSGVRVRRGSRQSVARNEE